MGREDQWIEEWMDRCECDPRPEDPDDCTCGVLDDFCYECGQWGYCKCTAADDRYHALKEEGLL